MFVKQKQESFHLYSSYNLLLATIRLHVRKYWLDIWLEIGFCSLAASITVNLSILCAEKRSYI